jgi:hypothetical protein
VKAQSPEQGDVEHGTKASNDATKPHAPSKPSAADVQTTRASTDAGGKKPHHPAAASTPEKTPKSPPSGDAQTHVVPSIEPRAEESQPATEPTQQQSPTLSTSQRLWNAAYDEEDKDTAELVRSYVKTITKVLTAKTPETFASGAGDIPAELKAPAKRQKYMEDLVKEGLAKISMASKITKGVGDVAQFILSAKGMIDAAIQNIPQAALPWAGVCVGLQVSNHPSQLPSLCID